MLISPFPHRPSVPLATQIATATLYRTKAKQAIDVLTAVVALPFLAPFILFFALLVRRDGGPAFFGHRRIGRNGRPFMCWKLRTMVPDAEAVLQTHLAAHPELAAQWYRDYKLKNDPRITRIGQFLRRTSLDELPQIWNVLRGEMSFVGPRPVTEPELEKYAGYQWAYLRLRPGITGAWQVSERNDVTYAERVGLDVAYASSITFWRDLRILVATVSVVLARTGR